MSKDAAADQTPAIPGLKRLALASAVIGVVAVSLVLFLFDPARVPIYPVCQFHRFTQLSCPGCGSLRALHALLHGHVAAALQFNLFLVLSLPLLAWLGIRFVRRRMAGKPGMFLRPAWLWLYLGAWIAFGVLRNLPIPILASFGACMTLSLVYVSLAPRRRSGERAGERGF